MNIGIQKLRLLLITLSCIMLASCSTMSYQGGGEVASKDTTTETGVRYLLGRGVPQSNSTAFSYFKEAADSDDDPFAQNEVAYLYAAGKGTSQDYKQAFVYYQKAADHGLASAQYNVGFFYAHGLGVAQNKTLATQWYQKAASHGFEPAKRVLGTS
jgi:TPR repeat protein